LPGKVLYKSSVSRDVKLIDSRDRERIMRQTGATSDDPKNGEPLHGEFAGLYKLRVGEYRIVYALIGQDVLVLRIRHRGKAYS
jgi:mRNA interferase RelE/StbE